MTVNFNASMYQVRFAYQQTFNKDIPAGCTYADAGNQIVHKLGMEAAKKLIQGIDNNSNNPYPLDAAYRMAEASNNIAAD